MSTKNYNTDAEIIADHEKTQCRSNRRQSVQFIDKNLRRRHSTTFEKQQQNIQQRAPLKSISSNDEVEFSDIDQQKQDCENLY